MSQLLNNNNLLDRFDNLFNSWMQLVGRMIDTLLNGWMY